MILERIAYALLWTGPELLIWSTAALLSLILLSRRPALPALLVLAAVVRLGTFVLSQATGIAASATLLQAGEYDAYSQVVMVRGAVTNSLYALILLLVVVAAFGWRSHTEPELPRG
jgi:hypothetical protein